VAELFGFLDAYVVTHFRAEEQLMAEHGFHSPRTSISGTATEPTR
jgi:hemerythrin